MYITTSILLHVFEVTKCCCCFYNQYLQTRILPKANLFLLIVFIVLIRKVRNYIECCFSGFKYLLSALTYNSSHLFLDENMIYQ